MRHIGLVVEGQGEIDAVPLLLRKYLHEIGVWQPTLGTPFCAKSRNNLLRDDGIENFVRLAAMQPGACGVLVVLDADGDKACEVGPACSARAAGATGLPTRTCLAVRQFENWIVASAESVFEKEVAPMPDHEGEGAISRIQAGMNPTKYVKPVYQPRLTARVDLDLASARCPSLARLFRCVDELVHACEGLSTATT